MPCAVCSSTSWITPSSPPGARTGLPTTTPSLAPMSMKNVLSAPGTPARINSAERNSGSARPRSPSNPRSRRFSSARLACAATTAANESRSARSWLTSWLRTRRAVNSACIARNGRSAVPRIALLRGL